MPANKPKVRIRMYRHGLGDCFLLTFSEGAKKTQMMIDCGVIVGTDKPESKMTDVANNILKETKGKLDVVAVTHEHWDHISGFVQAKPVFNKIKFGEVWVGWTEEPGNKIADELREEKAKKLKAIDKAVKKLKGLDPTRWTGFGETVSGLLEFEGGDLGVADDDPTAKKDDKTTAAAWKYVLGKVDKPRPFRPGGKTYDIPGMKGFRLYILGPPESKEAIKKMYTPKSETYHGFAGLTLENGFYAALGAADEKAPFSEFAELALPFDRTCRLDAALAEPEFAGSYYSAGQEWRQIEDDWLVVSGALALNINSSTNNTCLAFAIEFIEPGKVGKTMIFPGDAQFGNWNSWKTLEWEIDEEKGKRKVKARDLLENAVFYKVGHHGSHNATLRENGLELMMSSELVAMIPVNQEMAKKKTWNMPYPPLLKRLKEKARGRVIHADKPDKKGILKDAEDILSATERKKFDNAMKDNNDLFVDYTVE